MISRHVVTNPEHPQKIHNAATGAGFATVQGVHPLPRTTSVESRVFGIRNKHINDKVFHEFAVNRGLCSDMIPTTLEACNAPSRKKPANPA